VDFLGGDENLCPDQNFFLESMYLQAASLDKSETKFVKEMNILYDKVWEIAC